MIIRPAIVLACLAIAACAVQPPPDTASVPPGGLLQFAWLWQYVDAPTAMQVLRTPIFTLPPEQTLQVLSNMPYIQSANIATLDAANQMLPGGDMAAQR